MTYKRDESIRVKLGEESLILSEIMTKIQDYKDGKSPDRYSFKRTNQKTNAGQIYLYTWEWIEDAASGTNKANWICQGSMKKEHNLRRIQNTYHEKVDILIEAVKKHLHNRSFKLHKELDKLNQDEYYDDLTERQKIDICYDHLKNKYKDFYRPEVIIRQIHTIIDRDDEIREELGLSKTQKEEL